MAVLALQAQGGEVELEQDGVDEAQRRHVVEHGTLSVAHHVERCGVSGRGLSLITGAAADLVAVDVQLDETPVLIAGGRGGQNRTGTRAAAVDVTGCVLHHEGVDVVAGAAELGRPVQSP